MVLGRIGYRTNKKGCTMGILFMSYAFKKFRQG